jgi:predicted dehydrogenase
MHVLADKPWIIEPADFDKLSRVLAKAKKKKLLAYDIMTERFEPTNALQKALVNSPDVFGELQPGTVQVPGVYIENVHHFMKSVAGRPNLRPTWFFDSQQQGEGMADTGTHLADLVQWTLAPDQVVDENRDVQVVGAQRWSTNVSAEQFLSVTGTEAPSVAELKVFANTQVIYKLRGTFVQMASMWNWQAPAGGGDWHYAVYRGTRASVEIRQGSKEKFVPELFVVPNSPGDLGSVEKALSARIASLSESYPGVSVKVEGALLHVLIPAALRMGHEAHFSQVTRAFLGYLKSPASLPDWESANMLAKYTVTTKATKLSREAPPMASFVSKAPR